MSLDLAQSMKLIGKLQERFHDGNVKADKCYDEWIADPGDYTESTNAMLDAGHPYLTKLLLEVIEEGLMK